MLTATGGGDHSGIFQRPRVEEGIVPVCDTGTVGLSVLAIHRPVVFRI